MVVIAVDPGKRKAGLAVGYDKTLLEADTVTRRNYRWLPGELVDRAEAALVRASVAYWRRSTPILLVMEQPVDYPGKPRRAEDLQLLRNQNEVLEGLVRTHLPQAQAVRYTPQAWKGNVPKDVHHRRLHALLEASEPWPEGHDARDAVGLFLFAVGRCGAGGVT